jgi:hypothetical protein
MIVTTAAVGLSLALSWPIFIDFVWGEGGVRVTSCCPSSIVGDFHRLERSASTR